MTYRYQICSGFIVVGLLVGCGSNESQSPDPSTSAVDHAAEARKQISDSNMEAELEKLEQEIEADNPDDIGLE